MSNSRVTLGYPSCSRPIWRIAHFIVLRMTCKQHKIPTDTLSNSIHGLKHWHIPLSWPPYGIYGKQRVIWHIKNDIFLRFWCFSLNFGTIHINWAFLKKKKYFWHALLTLCLPGGFPKNIIFFFISSIFESSFHSEFLTKYLKLYH